MTDILMYVALGLGIFFVILLILAIAGKGAGLRKWLGPIGGLVIAIVAIAGIGSATGKSDLDKIHAENERIQKELDRLKKESEAVNAKYAADKAEYEKKIVELETQLAEKEEARKALQAQLKNTAQQDPLTWLKNLPEEERKKIIKDINDDITWI